MKNGQVQQGINGHATFGEWSQGNISAAVSI